MSQGVKVESMKHLKELMRDQILSIIYFDTNSWGVGKELLKKLKDLAKQYNVKILLVDIDKDLLIRGQYQVFTAPTVLLMKNKKEILRESKFIDFKNIQRILDMMSNK